MFGQYSILKVGTYKVSMILSLRSFKSSCLLISVISSPACLTVDTDPESFDPGSLPVEAYESVEADSFWCLSALLDGIQVFLSRTKLIKGQLCDCSTRDTTNGGNFAGTNHTD